MAEKEPGAHWHPNKRTMVTISAIAATALSVARVVRHRQPPTEQEIEEMFEADERTELERRLAILNDGKNGYSAQDLSNMLALFAVAGPMRYPAAKGRFVAAFSSVANTEANKRATMLIRALQTEKLLQNAPEEPSGPQKWEMMVDPDVQLRLQSFPESYDLFSQGCHFWQEMFTPKAGPSQESA